MNTRYGFVFGLPPKVLGILKPNLIFVVWSKPEKIYEHLKMDKGKVNREDREKFGLGQIKEMQELEKGVSIQYGFYCDCPVKFVLNVEGEADKVAQEISGSILQIS